MTRTVGANLLTNAQSRAPTLAWAIVVVRTDAEVYRWTTHDADVELGGQDYISEPGIQVLSLALSSGFAVDNTEFEVLAGDEITRADILAGRWDAAAFQLSVFNWKVPADGAAVLMTGTLGDLRPRNGRFVAELRDLRQALQQDATDVVQPDCRYRLGDAKCTVDLSDPTFTVTGTVTSSADRYHVTDTARTEADDWFGEGEIEFDAPSPNAGLRFKVRAYASDTFTLAVPAIFAITPGDTYTAIVGCRKRALADCRDKFDNIINFGGEPDKARADALLAGAA